MAACSIANVLGALLVIGQLCVRRGAQSGRFEQEATEETEMESGLCFLRYLLLNLEAAAFSPDDADFFSRFAPFAGTFPAQWQGRPSQRVPGDF